MKIFHQTRAFENILKEYDGSLPLHRFLFSFFKQNKQMGSSDRRWATRYLYSYFRLGKALSELDTLTRLAIGDFLCHDTDSLVITHYLPDLLVHIDKSIDEKLEMISRIFPSFEISDIFSWIDQLSVDIDPKHFLKSFLVQPDLFIRVNDNLTESVAEKLRTNGISFELKSKHTFALPNGTKLEQVLPDASTYQIQDLSSQKTGAYFQPQRYDYWWDCCAASGGKSLLLHEIEPQIELLVSDVRPNSLANLDERFQLAGIRKYQKKVIDLLQNNEQILHHYEFDGILVDAPCSGSGTWGRTPEMLQFFESRKIQYYAGLQRSIVSNVVKYLKVGKPLVYMTCSVFEHENEALVKFMTENLPLQLQKMELIKGYNDRADSMFVARLIKV